MRLDPGCPSSPCLLTLLQVHFRVRLGQGKPPPVPSLSLIASTGVGILTLLQATEASGVLVFVLKKRGSEMSGVDSGPVWGPPSASKKEIESTHVCQE